MRNGALAALASALLALGCAEPGAQVDDPSEEARFGGLLHGAKGHPAAGAAAGDAPAVDVDRAARDAGELLRAARMPHRRVGALLGAHVARATTSIEVSAGTAGQERDGAEGEAEAPGTETLEVEARIDYERDDRFHVLVENSQDYGREVVFADGALYLRPRYSKLHRRPPTNADEPARIRDDVFAELGAHLDLVRAGIEVHDQGPVNYPDAQGRPARRIEIRKAAKPRRARPEPAAHRKWRETVVVDEVAGEIVLDRETGVPLSGTLRARVSARRDGQPLRMDITVEHRIESIGGPVTIAVPSPEEWVPTPERSRELEERNALLESIAQPARAAPTPSNPSGSPSSTPAGDAEGSGDAAGRKP